MIDHSPNKTIIAIRNLIRELGGMENIDYLTHSFRTGQLANAVSDGIRMLRGARYNGARARIASL